MFLTGSFYSNSSSNQLLNYLLPTTTGFSLVPENLAATVRNYGWELTITSENISHKDFRWNSSINVTIPRNKLTSFPGIENTAYNSSLIIGKPLGIIKAFNLVGVNDTTGIYEFLDSKGNKSNNPVMGIDNTVVIDKLPRYYGGISNTLRYKNFTLDLLFQFTKQIGTNYLLPSGSRAPGYIGTNVNSENSDRWTTVNQYSEIQKATQSAGSATSRAYAYATQSNYAYVDASFIRLKNLSISYSLSSNIVRSLNIHDCRIYLRGQNLLTISKYKGADPENQSLSAIPPLRVLIAGIDVTF